MWDVAFCRENRNAGSKIANAYYQLRFCKITHILTPFWRRQFGFDKQESLSDDASMPTHRHSIARTCVLVFAWLLFWTLMALASVQDFVRDGNRDIWQPLLWEGSSALVGSVLVLAQVRLTRGMDRWLDRPARWFALQAAWLPAYWIAFIPLVFGIRHAVYAALGRTYHHEAWPALFLHESTRISIYFGLFTAILFGVKSYGALADEKLRAEQANTLLRETQLQRLAQQMQPHFLFNALNTISSLMHTDVERADATLLQLADVLRATLALDGRHEAPLAAELALARDYAGVMSARFDGRVTIAWDVDESALDAAVPVMSLQPLLENVFKHTVEKRRGPTRIGVSARREGEALVVRVEDDQGRLAPAPPAQPGRGIGLANLRARLDALYGSAARLTLAERADGGGVRAELTMPCVRMPCAS
jgi:two-component system LytT family sensor kinase